MPNDLNLVLIFAILQHFYISNIFNLEEFPKKLQQERAEYRIVFSAKQFFEYLLPTKNIISRRKITGI